MRTLFYYLILAMSVLPVIGQNNNIERINNTANIRYVDPSEPVWAIASSMRSGTLLKMGRGIFNVGTNAVKLPVGVGLVGEGPGLTVIIGFAGLTTNGPVVHVNSTNTVAHLSIKCGNKNFYNQASLGGFTGFGSRAATNVFIENVDMEGDSDGLYFNHTQPSYVFGWGLNSIAKWDSGAFLGSGLASNSVFTFFNCNFEANLSGSLNPASISAATSRGIVLECGTINLIGCRVIATNADNAYAVANNEVAPGKVFVTGSIIRAAGTNSSAPILSASMPVEFAGNSFGYRELAISGTVNYQTPGSLFASNIVMHATKGLVVEDVEDLAESVANFGPTTGGLYLGSLTDPDGHLCVGPAGKGLKIAEGSNARMGTATMSSGLATISTTAVGANSRVFLQVRATANPLFAIAETNRVNGTSFQVRSLSPTDANTVSWMIVDPAP